MAATTINIPDFLEVRGDTVPEQAFIRRTDLLNVVVPDTITRIGNNAFFGCWGLVKLSLPNSLSEIGDRAFHGCSGLVELRLPNSLSAIGDSAFRGCSGMVELSLPDTLTAIGSYAFRDCFGLVELNLPNILRAIGYSAFGNCSGLVELTLPDTLTSIGDFAFHDCTGLVELNLPDALTSIGHSAFRSCSGLVGLHLPDALTSIGNSAFHGCSGLVELNLPDTLTAIGVFAFCECENLRCLVLPPALVSLGATVFQDSMINLRMLVVPLPVPFEYAATIAAIFGRGDKLNYRSDPDDTKCDTEAVDFPTDSIIQLVSAPDAVVASLRGVFAEMATMSEVRAAGRAVSGVAEHCYWGVRTHLHQVCTRSQRVCAHTLLLVGARLYSESVTSSTCGTASDRSSHTNGREAVPQLPALPNELWVLVLGWLRRSALGVAK
jgi:hypothetical protein